MVQLRKCRDLQRISALKSICDSSWGLQLPALSVTVAALTSAAEINNLTLAQLRIHKSSSCAKK